MKSWHDDDLILHLYGEHPRAAELARNLATDEALAGRFAALARELAPLDLLEAPEPAPDFEERTWNALRPRLVATPHRRGWRALVAAPPVWRFAALTAALVVALAAAFWAGRRTADLDITPTAVELPGALTPEARERLLRASLAGHFESSALLLTDLSHAPDGGNLAAERQWAATLLASNRLYRQAAQRGGQRRIVALLDELEPLLVELAHHPADAGLGGLQHRIAERDLLFKVRVVGSRLGAGREYPTVRSTS